MKADQRDLGLGAALDETASKVRPDGDARLSSVRRRGAARRTVRLAGAVCAVSVFVGVVAWAGLGLAGRGSPPARTGLAGYVDPRIGWTVRYPESWRLVQVRQSCPLTGVQGFRVGNFTDGIKYPSPRSTPDGHGGTQVFCSFSPRLGSFPATGVAVQVQRLSGGGFLFAGKSEVRFPLSLADGERTRIRLADGRTITRYSIRAAIKN